MDIELKIEAARGCGFRKKGGLYLIAGKPNAPCGRLPIPLDICPCCHGGIKPTRGWTWVQPKPLFAAKPCAYQGLAIDSEGPTVMFLPHSEPALSGIHRTCPLSDQNLPERAGLLWIGGAFYKRPEDYMSEAARMGLSRRISAVPKDFVVGETWVLLAHRECIPNGVVMTGDCDCGTPDGVDKHLDRCSVFEKAYQAGVFTMFKPERIEYVVKGTETDDELEAVVARGLTPVMVQNPDGGACDSGDDSDNDD